MQILPVLIMNGANKKQEFCDELPAGSDMYMNTKSSNISAELFLGWFVEHFMTRKPTEKTHCLTARGQKAYSTVWTAEEASFVDLSKYNSRGEFATPTIYSKNSSPHPSRITLDNQHAPRQGLGACHKAQWHKDSQGRLCHYVRCHVSSNHPSVRQKPALSLSSWKQCNQHTGETTHPASSEKMRPMQLREEL
ncbi:hypothetical protein PR048_007632 [Dryococelus australis]|uniref:Uncharacterized protein n=1 Tax=Dryococelus australis TaxID=614101 RepID=A0ABQ9HVR2_9NEOP|nr:hypothetical protein PR048_007632 [Dryococelus australis]